MKTSLFPLAGLLPAFLITSLHGQALGLPVLANPGNTATWTTENIATGTRTVFTINANSVFDWNGFNLPSGSELVFDFVGGNSVVNMLNGTSTNVLAGNVTSNGNVGFFSPDANLVVSGNITAKSVTLSALDVDTASFLSGGSYTLSGGLMKGLTVTGQIRAMDGDIVLAGRTVLVDTGAKLKAKGAAQIAGGTEVVVERTGSGQRLKQSSGTGFVLHLGDTRASRIEIAAGKQIVNEGRLDVGNTGHRIFLEVGKDGKITRDSSGLIIGNLSVNGKQEVKASSLRQNEGDAASAVSTSTLKMPALKRPDGTVASASRTLVNNAPMSASADGGRDRKRQAPQVASHDRGRKPLLQRASFFGMRGGSTPAKR
jgi:hypothetical protein